MKTDVTNLSVEELSRIVAYYEWMANQMLSNVALLRRKYPNRSVTFLCHPMSAPTPEGVEANLKAMAELIIFFSFYTTTVIPNQIAFNALFNEDDPQHFPLKLEVFYQRVLAACDQVLVVEGHEGSVGCTHELLYAREIGKPVYLYRLAENEVLIPGKAPVPLAKSVQLSDVCDFTGIRAYHHNHEIFPLISWERYAQLLD